MRTSVGLDRGSVNHAGEKAFSCERATLWLSAIAQVGGPRTLALVNSRLRWPWWLSRTQNFRLCPLIVLATFGMQLKLNLSVLLLKIFWVPSLWGIRSACSLSGGILHRSAFSHSWSPGGGGGGGGGLNQIIRRPLHLRLLLIGFSFFSSSDRKERSLMFHFTQNIQVRQQWRWAGNLWFCATHHMGGLATPYTNHQQHINMMSTANHSASKYRNQAQKLEEKQSCKVGAHQTDNGWVGWDHQIHTSRLPRMIRNHMYRTPAYIRRHVSSAWQPVS